MSNWQSWQWPTDDVPAPTIVPFSRSLNGRPADWEALVFPAPGKSLSHIYLRPAKSDDLFCICDSEGNMARAGISLSIDAWRVRMVCADAFTNAKIARLFYVSERGQLRKQGESASASVSLRSNGRGLWNAPHELALHHSAQNRAPFLLFGDVGVGAFMSRPAPDMWRELQSALDTPQSDAAFAHDWASKNDTQRKAALWNWPSDTRAELRTQFQEWLLCILLCQESLWQSDEMWTLSVPDASNIYLFTEAFWEEHPIPDELRRAVEQLWHHFAPFKPEVLTHECALAWKQNAVTAFQAEAHQPSAHERLEAMMNWRDWEAEHNR